MSSIICVKVLRKYHSAKTSFNFTSYIEKNSIFLIWGKFPITAEYVIAI